jgi:hypothetical protein
MNDTGVNGVLRRIQACIFVARRRPGLGGRLPSRTLCHIELASFSLAWPLDYVGSESKKEESAIERETEGGLKKERGKGSKRNTGYLETADPTTLHR